MTTTNEGVDYELCDSCRGAISIFYWPLAMPGISLAFIVIGIAVLRIHLFLVLNLAAVLTDPAHEAQPVRSLRLPPAPAYS